ncbi:hypothetical protein BD410DRAFT_841055 [Rickenella mellea]|uniref:Uncharacterized protein n=1 Tax=Rickenella mellea TaxID=50990 RepID=A0A4Y7PZP0_9AGAM|nr:hypothetical protein BD410DRAFT_841055 [Rickenella mellea]
MDTKHDVSELVSIQRARHVFNLPELAVEPNDPEVVRTHPIKTMSPEVGEAGQIEWKDFHDLLSEIDGIGNDLDGLDKVHKCAVNGSEGDKVVTVSAKHWAKVPEHIKRSVFSRRSIHVRADGTQQSVAPTVHDWTARNLEKMGIDPRLERQAHDMTHPSRKANKKFEKRLHQLMLETWCDNREEWKNKKVLNILDIPCPNKVLVDVSELSDGDHLSANEYRDKTWCTRWPIDCLSWALVASRRAVSGKHIDATGFATWLQIVLGAKLWYIAREYPLPTKDGWSDDHSAYKWQVVVLRAGDTL